MALIIPNIGYSAMFDQSTGQMLAVFSKMDSISIDVDGTLTPLYGGPGMFPIVNIGADRKPQVSIKGSETSLQAAGSLGANVTTAQSGSPIQIDRIEELTIAADGTVTLPNGDAISATVTTVHVIGALDGKTFSGVASAPTAGQFANPAAGATTITCNTSDAGKSVFVHYSIDSTSGGQVDYNASATSKVVKFVAAAKVVNTEAAGQPLVPITFTVYSCQFMGKWTISQERQKASSTQLDLQILDPGGNKPAVTIASGAKFAG